MTTASFSSPSERRKRLRLKRIVVSEHNYLALKRLGQAGDSFNDVISKLLRIERNYQETRQQQEQQQQEKENNGSRNGELPFPDSLYELFDERNRQQLSGLLSSRTSNNRGTNNQIIKHK